MFGENEGTDGVLPNPRSADQEKDSCKRWDGKEPAYSVCLYQRVVLQTIFLADPVRS
jgi:hypothetical protein